MNTSQFSNMDPHGSDSCLIHEPFYRKTKFWLIILLILVIIIFIEYNPFFKKKKKIPTVPVVVAQAQNSNVAVYLNELGGVTPVYNVTVKTVINGPLLKVVFTEGQMVKKGDLLAEIDPRPYQAQLLEYEGQLVRDKALLANAQLDLKRYQMEWKQDSVAKQVLDTQVSLVRQYMGAVQSDEGLIQTTKVNLMYCEITSPVDGRIGLRLVDPGNIVQTSDTTGIAVIATLNPITVIFSIPEDNIPDVLEQIDAGKTLTVNAYDRQQKKLLAVGTLLTIDNQIDTTTGTVKMRAQFDNNDMALFPNQFVNVQLLVKTLQGVTTVPTPAVQYGPQNKTFVYLLHEDKTVSVQPIVLGVTSGENTVITNGVSPGQSVVIEGSDKLTDGAHVEIADPKHPASAETSAELNHHHVMPTQAGTQWISKA